MGWSRFCRHSDLFPCRVVERIEQVSAGHKFFLFRLTVIQVKGQVPMILRICKPFYTEGRHDKAALGSKQLVQIILDPPVKIMCGYRYDVPLLFQCFLCGFFLLKPETGLRQLFKQRHMIHALRDIQHPILVQQTASRLKAECRSAQIAHFCIHRFAQRVGQRPALSVFQHEPDLHSQNLPNM